VVGGNQALTSFDPDWRHDAYSTAFFPGNDEEMKIILEMTLKLEGSLEMDYAAPNYSFTAQQ